MKTYLILCLMLIAALFNAAFAEADQQTIADKYSAVKAELQTLESSLVQNNNPATQDRIIELKAELVSLLVGDYNNSVVVCPDTVGVVSDHCANAILIPVPSHIFGQTTGMTSDEVPMCNLIGTNASGSVWYRVIGNGNTFTATTCDICTNFDTRIRVFGCGCENLTCIASNDDRPCDFTSVASSTVSWCTESGVEYLILVDGALDFSGRFALTITTNQIPCTNPVTCEPSGRCCYYVNNQATCSMLTQNRCNYLGGNWAEGRTCEQPCPTVGDCGPMDLVFIVDTTGSMNGAINSVKAELPNIIALANTASGGDLRLGLVTFGDRVTTLQQLAGGAAHIAAVQTSINGLTAAGGMSYPEASDEALLEVIYQKRPRFCVYK